jgi:hypothetical protein
VKIERDTILIAPAPAPAPPLEAREPTVVPPARS